jgi:hypothetical protein
MRWSRTRDLAESGLSDQGPVAQTAAAIVSYWHEADSYVPPRQNPLTSITIMTMTVIIMTTIIAVVGIAGSHDGHGLHQFIEFNVQRF